MDAESWKWVWLATAAVFFVGEMVMPGSFFLLPFAIGAGLSTIAGFAGVETWIQWAIFVTASGVAFLALRPLATSANADTSDEGIGAKRLVGSHATAVDLISGDNGLVRFEAEDWRAISDDGSRIAAGTPVIIVEVRGTRVVVRRAG